MMSERSRALVVVVGILVMLFHPSAMSDEVPTGKLPAGVAPTHYRLDLNVDPRSDRFSGVARINLRLDEATGTIWLHGRDLEVTDAFVDADSGERVSATYSEVNESGVVRIDTARTLEPGAATLTIRYGAPFNRSLEGLYRVERGNGAYAYTHFQPLSARRAFPGFDEPRFKTPFEISVTIADGDVAVSNAPVKDSVPLNGGRRQVLFHETKPIPTYLVALAVGEFDVVEWTPIPSNAIRARPIPLRGIAPKGKGYKLSYALQHTEALLTILEEYFAIPYPYAKLDLVAAAAFNSGGMENVGAIFYREEYLLLDEAPSIYQLRDYAYIHAHELAHSWFGNLVTPLWWDDLWLNESFATWMSDRVVHIWRPGEFDDRGPIRRARRAMGSDRFVSARSIRQPIVNNHDIANAFDRITYSKGAGVLSMIELYMGSKAFREGVRRFMLRYEHDVATAEDFFASLSESVDDPDIIHAFRSFVEQSGTPLIAVNWACDVTGSAVVSLSQSRSLPLGSNGDRERRWFVPMCLAFDDGGERRSQCMMLKEQNTSIRLDTKQCPRWILPNGAGAAYLHFSLPDDKWDALISEVPRLKPSEVLSIVESIGSAYQAGLVDTGRVLSLSEVVARSPYWDVASAPVQDLRDVKNFVLPDAMYQTATARMRQIYNPALARFDLTDTGLAVDESSSDLALLRGDLLWFMALDAEDPELRRRLSALGQAYVGYGAGGALKREVIHPNLVLLALIVATDEAGAHFADALIDRLRNSDDAVLRSYIIRALAYQKDPETVERVWLLIFDPSIPKRDAGQLLRRLGNRVANREVLFEWMLEHYDAIVERLPRSHLKWLPWRASAFCDDAGRARVAEFFGERVKAHLGGPRVLENVLETIEICAAVVKFQRAGAIEAFTEAR